MGVRGEVHRKNPPSPVRIHLARDGGAACNAHGAFRFTENPFAVTCAKCRRRCYKPMGEP